LLFDISFVAKHSIYQGVRPVPGSTIIDRSCSEQEQLLFELRRARFGYWLALHLILLCAAGYTPTQIAAVLFGSRSSVYRAVNAYRTGSVAGLEMSALSLVFGILKQDRLKWRGLRMDDDIARPPCWHSSWRASRSSSE